MHNVESRGIRYALLAAGFLASMFALVGSMVLNYRYGHALARTPEDGLIFGVLAIASDVFMAASLFFYFEAKKRNQYTQMVAAIIVWVATTAFAGVAAISQASMNRIDAVAHRTAASTSYSDTRTELTEARKLRDKIGVWSKSETTASTDIAKHKTSKLWTQSSECQEIAGKAQREYCSQYQTLVGELATAQQVAKLDKRIEDLVGKSDAAIAKDGAVGSEADPAAATIASATGYSQRNVQTGIVIGFAGLMLILCSLGPYISSSMLEAYQPKPARNLDTIDAEAKDITPAVDTKAALEQPVALKALPKPTTQWRPEPASEWRALLTQLDYPKPGWTPERDAKGHFVDRKRDADGALGLRFFTWLVAHGETGQFAHERIDELYAEFTRLDFRTPVATRVVKAQLSDVKKWVIRNNTTPVTWIISAPPIAILKALLIKRKVLAENPTPEAGVPATARTDKGVAEESGAPFPSPGSGPPSAPLEVPASDPKPVRKVIKGLAELTQYLPDLDGMRRLERANKAAWQAKGQFAHRPFLHRFSRSRAA